MEARTLTDRYAVSPQISPEDMPEIVSAGYTTILCNRPDEEVPPGLRADDLRAAVEAAGLAFVENPVRHGQITPDTIAKQATAMAASKGPVLAYCASGNRSAFVWSIVAVGNLGTDGVLSRTRAAGYDHSMLRPQLEALAKG